MTLDPPDATGAEAGRPELDEDYLILSTIHSAKGQEWDAVYVLNLVDGCIPSDMATGNPAQIEEERRLLYVAMTRAKQHLHLVQPLRFFRTHQHRFGSGCTIAPRSRFLPDDILPLFTRRAPATPEAVTDTPAQIDEERRLLYVAMTRAKQHLHLIQPLRFFRTHQHRSGSAHTMAPRSRFRPEDILPLFTRRAAATPDATAETPAPQPVVSVDIGARLRGMWG